MADLSPLLSRLKESAFMNDADCPFPAHLESAAQKVLVVAGDNASGKSLMFRLLASIAHDEKMQPITLSIRERGAMGQSEMSGIMRAMVFGDESKRSTGATSVDVTQRGFKNVVQRAEEGTPSVLMLDEPELGLSENYAHAFGCLLADQIAALPEGAPGLILVSHSRPLIRALTHRLKEAPSFLMMGEYPSTLEEWLNAAPDRSVEQLLELVQRNRNLARRFDQWQEQLKVKKWAKARAENPDRPYCEEELNTLSTEVLDKMAFGRSNGEVIDVSPVQIHIQYPGDLDNPEYQYEQGGKRWLNAVDLSEPVEVSLDDDGKMWLEDGHHRWFAAKKRKEVLKARVTIKGNPIRRILKKQQEAAAPSGSRQRNGPRPPRR